jgi:hypothetical protein
MTASAAAVLVAPSVIAAAIIQKVFLATLPMDVISISRVDVGIRLKFQTWKGPDSGSAVMLLRVREYAVVFGTQRTPSGNGNLSLQPWKSMLQPK